MASTLALSLVCLAVFSVMIGIASLGLALFVVLRDRLFPVNETMLRSKATQLQRQSEDMQSISHKNEQLYAVNDNNVIDLDDAGLIKMNRLRIPRGVQSKIDETAFITENADAIEDSSIDEMMLKSSQHPSDGEYEKTVDDVEMLQNSSRDNDKLSDDPTMKREDQFLEDSDSMNDSEHSPNKLNIEKQVIPLNSDPKEDLQMEEVDKQNAATSMTTAKTSTTIITEVTLTIEPPFEKVVVEPLCSTGEMPTC
uniref:Transmembrane protein n=1 Tax=Ascaris lumbricoides TaxID=6252 RepID=A0A0M3HZW1_ASCLU